MRPISRSAFLGQGNQESTVQTLMPRSFIFPPRRQVVLKGGYQTQLSLPNTGLIVEHVMALNGLYNMSITNAGGQPYVWTTISGLYGKYRVDRCRAVIKFTDPTADGVLVGLQLRGPAVVGNTPTNVIGRPGNVATAMSNTGDQVVTYPIDVDMAKAFGQTKAIYHANYGADVTANPGASSFDFTCFLRVWGANPANTVSTVTVEMQFEFDVDLFDLQI